MANLSSLNALAIVGCHLFGEFPVRIFQLPNLEILSVRYNQDLTGYFPEFNRSSPLMLLKVSFTRFFGNIPSSFRNLDSLQELDVAQCNFSEGLVPSSLGNLRKLTDLDISLNRFGGPIPDSLANLTSFSNLTNLQILYLHSNSLSVKSLERLDLSRNKIRGQVPKWMWNTTIETLVLLAISQNFILDQPPLFLPWVKLILYHNILTGSITSSLGTQLTSLKFTSYEGNPGLCGDPLPKKCGNPKAPQLPPSTVDEGDSSSEGIFEFDWKIVSAGCGSGLVVGVVLADVVITRRPDLFLKSLE
ncbi:hypothetical protein ACFX1R_042374 [Malus domestica]